MNYEESLIQQIFNDKNIIVVTAENRASIRSLPDIVGDQFIDTGISEQSLVCIAAGLALRGRVPVVHAIASFLTMRAFEFIRTDIGYPNLNVKLVGNFAGFLSEANGPTHQAIEDISLMRGIPNMNVFCPADLDDLVKGLPIINNHYKPCYIRYNDLPSEVEHSEFILGTAEVFGNGTDVAILVYGALFTQAYKAKNMLEEKGISVRLLNLRTVKPIDEIEIIDAVKSCKTLVTIEDHFQTGGLATIVSEILTREKLITDMLPISLGDRFFKPALLNDILEYEGFTAEQLADKIINHFQTKRRNFHVEWSNV